MNVENFNILLEDKQDNLFVVVKTTVENGKGKFFINALSPTFVLDKIIEFVNESSYKSVIFVCRSYKEHYCKPCPPEKDINYLFDSLDKTFDKNQFLLVNKFIKNVGIENLKLIFK